MADIRFDPLEQRWTVMAPERSRRPQQTRVPEPEPESSAICPFCPGNEAQLEPLLLAWPAPPAAARIRVFPNSYPLFTVEDRPRGHAEGLYDVLAAIGAHEIIVDGKEHDLDLADHPVEHLAAYLACVRARMADLHRDFRLRQILLFKNSGFLAGATLEHAHSQLVATPLVPQTMRRRLRSCRDHYRRKERCLLQDIVDQELTDGRRVVRHEDELLTFVPFAAQDSFQMTIVPSAAVPAFAQLGEARCAALAAAIKDALGRLHAALDRPAYNLALYAEPNWPTLPNSVFGAVPHAAFRWHVKISPRLVPWAGFEWSTALHVNTVLPEEAAERLRAAGPGA
jgi:UDPglucose--hexose-1-phosphate uridylyltransferase